MVQRWFIEFEEHRENISSFPTWVKLWHLPKELIEEEDDDKGRNFSSSLIGTPYSMDLNTKRRHKLAYYIFCVLVTADQELPTEMLVDVGRNSIFNIEYEWLPLACKKCNVFGHRTDSCE